MSETKMTMTFKDCGVYGDLWNFDVVKTYDTEHDQEDSELKQVDWGMRIVEMDIVKVYDIRRCT